MNKTTKVLLLSLVLFIVALAYIYQPTRDVDTITTSFPESEGDTHELNERLTYSNLFDQASQEEVRDAMRFAGIQEKNIDSFLQEVEGFNTIIGGKSLVSSGFSTINSFEPDYDYVEMIEKWDAQYPEFIGYNCRISTYDLMKDFISVKNPDTKDSQWLVFDANAIENNPKKLFSPQEYEDFKTLFASIPAEDTTDIQVHLKNVQAEWKRRGITFNQDHKASIISVFFHDFEDYLFIGHMGVLLPTPEGKLLFLEKLSFHAPYQAIKFNNRVELNDYLMGKYDISWNQPTAKPFIMENDELLEGYRPNQKESTNH